MANEPCWYKCKRMRLDEDGGNNNINNVSIKDEEKWTCATETSLVESQILADMGVSMLTDGEASRDSLKGLQTQECTIPPKNFEEEMCSKSKIVTYDEDEEVIGTFQPENTDRFDALESDEVVNFSTRNESGYSSSKIEENFVEAKESFNKDDSNDELDKGADPFFLFRRKKRPSVEGEDKFNNLSDEIVLMILKWLPKKSLVRSMLVCKRWYQIAIDEALWTRLDLGHKVLNPGTLGYLLPRGIHILRMAQAEIGSPPFISTPDINFDNFTCKLEFLDLSMAVVSSNDLAEILSKCKYLKKLSLENCTLNESCCDAIGSNENLEVLNLTMCEGFNIKCMKSITKLTKLSSLNVGWCSFDSESVAFLCASLPSSITKLNIAGCRKTMTDNNIKDLVQSCPDLVVLDISDCTLLTTNVVQILVNLTKLEHLSINRCYGIPHIIHRRFAQMPNLKVLDIFGLTDENSFKALQASCKFLFNKSLFSNIARPTVGVKRTSIWDLRVTDLDRLFDWYKTTPDGISCTSSTAEQEDVAEGAVYMIPTRPNVDWIMKKVIRSNDNKLITKEVSTIAISENLIIPRDQNLDFKLEVDLSPEKISETIIKCRYMKMQSFDSRFIPDPYSISKIISKIVPDKSIKGFTRD